MKVTVIRKTITNWSNKDFLLYYSSLMEQNYNQKLEIPPVAWQGFLSRIKGFREKLNINNIDYKDFIDLVFSDFFKRADYIPSFGTIVSEKVYVILTKYKTLKHSKSSEKFDWEQYKNNLYSDTSLFRKLL